MTKGRSTGVGYMAHVNIIKRGYNSPAIPIPIPLMRQAHLEFGMLGVLEWDGKKTFTFTVIALPEAQAIASARDAAQRIGEDAEAAEIAATDGMELKPREGNLVDQIAAARAATPINWKTEDVPDEPDLGETFR